MNNTIKADQSIKGLEAAYRAVYHRSLKERVLELYYDYSEDQLPALCTELNPDNSVPCFWTLPELVSYYIEG